MNREQREQDEETGRPRASARSYFPRGVAQWLSAALVFAILGLAGAFAGAASGVANLSAIPPHPEGWARFLHYGMERSVKVHAHPSAPTEPLDSAAMILRGATQYSLVCENCHGAPGLGQSPVALSMRPEPPLITRVANDYSENDLYFIVQNGVRYTGMPAWPVDNRPDEIWAIVAFLEAMPKMDHAAYVSLVRGTSDDSPSSIFVGPSAASGSPSIATFVASTRERPYLPGDPQTPFPSPAATEFPRTGFGHVTAGANDLAECAMCHAADGAGRAGGDFPNLTLQTPQYLYDALKSFAKGQRQSGIMWPIAANLTDDQMRAIATRIGNGPPVPSPRDGDTIAAPAETASRGSEIVDQGLDSQGRAQLQAGPDAPAPAVERCSSCHFSMAYLNRVIPALSGQNAAYLRMQLRAFRDGGRGDTSAYDPMTTESHRLSDADIVAAARYYASSPPEPKPR